MPGDDYVRFRRAALNIAGEHWLGIRATGVSAAKTLEAACALLAESSRVSQGKEGVRYVCRMNGQVIEYLAVQGPVHALYRRLP